jgi:LEA14-like dessication related protein
VEKVGNMWEIFKYIILIWIMTKYPIFTGRIYNHFSIPVSLENVDIQFLYNCLHGWEKEIQLTGTIYKNPNKKIEVNIKGDSKTIKNYIENYIENLE